MPIDDIKATEPVKPYMGNKQQGGKHHPRGRNPYEQAQDAYNEASPKNDETSFMGIPQDELTSAVTSAISSLMEEVDKLRSELSMTHGLEDMLSDSVDHHADMPVLTRHALIRELTIALARMSQTESNSTFAYIQISNFATLKDEFGLVLSHDVLCEVGKMLKEQLRETDLIGTLGGDGFGIVLSLSEAEAALKKVNQLKAHIEQAPMMFGGHVLAMQLVYGVCTLLEGGDVKDVLRLADQDMHKRKGRA